MKIAGLQNLSLVDFPGYLAMTVFSQGCNFRCGYCHNPELLDPQRCPEILEEDFFSLIKKRRDKIEGVVLTGGEPTLHSDLVDFASKIKEIGLKVKLDTNGSSPWKIYELIKKGLIDYLAVDVKTSFAKYHFCSGDEYISDKIEASIDIARLSAIPYEFRTTCVPEIVEESDLCLIGEIVKGAKKYCLQQFRPMITYEERFKKIRPYAPSKLNHFKTILEKYVEEVEVRGV